jgi:hypothetical protein
MLRSRECHGSMEKSDIVRNTVRAERDRKMVPFRNHVDVHPRAWESIGVVRESRRIDAAKGCSRARALEHPCQALRRESFRAAHEKLDAGDSRGSAARVVQEHRLHLQHRRRLPQPSVVRPGLRVRALELLDFRRCRGGHGTLRTRAQQEYQPKGGQPKFGRFHHVPPVGPVHEKGTCVRAAQFRRTVARTDLSEAY